MAAHPQVQNRRKEIVELLFGLHGMQLVRRLTRMLGQVAFAEEVAQDTYERLLRWPLLEEVSPEARKAVMFATGSRLAIDHLRRAQTIARRAVALEASNGDTVFEHLASPERQVLAQQAIARLTEIIDSLPERLREPMVLRYVEELPRPVICARLGIVEDNLDQRIREARARCQEQMASIGFDWLWLD